MRNGRLKTFGAMLMSVALCTTLIGGCSQPEPEEIPMPAPVVVAPAPPPPEPEPEPEPEPVFTLPLTGEQVEEDDIRLLMRPLSVKIENTPESRPSLGITLADVVYETITEGGITRFNALFHSQVPPNAGSIRSARNSDVTIVPAYNALFVFSGTNSLVWADIAGTIDSLIEEGSAGKALYRISHKAGPHNLYLDTALAFDRFEERGNPIGSRNLKGLAFGENDTSALEPKDDAIEIFVPFSGSYFDVKWVYEPATERYMRFIRDVEQCDEGYGNEQIYADNVVMLSVPYLAAPDVPGKGQTYNLNMTGSGDAIVFQNGVRIDCTWRTDGTHPPVFEDSKGEPVFLKPGKTWFQVPRDIFAAVITTGHIEFDDPEAVEAAMQETDEAAMQAAIDADVDEARD